MNELKISTNLETISLNKQTKCRLIEIGKIKDYLEHEIRYQQLLTSKLCKYLTGFDYADKILTIFLTALSLWDKHLCSCKRRKTITWIDCFRFFFIVLFKFWYC